MSNQSPQPEMREGHNAAQELLPAVYDDLRRIAAAKMHNERSDHTLDATALVHEAYLKLGGDRTFSSRTGYIQAAALAMRRILVDHARHHRAEKRKGGLRVDMEPGLIAAESMSDEMVEALDES